jgi:hyaluronan synthase
MEILQEWLNQTFCGQPANIGEDRAMTNLILREGHYVLFQQNARVYTEVPVKYVNLCKMYLRWARSNIRETIAMTRFIFKPFREGSKLGARINLISGWMALTKAQIFLLITWGFILWHPMTFGVNTLIGILISSSLAAAIYAWKFNSFSSLWAFVYGFYFFTALFWIRPYALMTPHKAGWLTRQIKSAPSAVADPVPVMADRIPAMPVGGENNIFLQKVKTAA